MASQAPIFVQNENLPIFRGIDGKKAGAARGPAAREGRQERKALADIRKAGKAPLGSAAGGKANAAASARGSKNAVKPGYLTDEEWMKCCEWAKGGIETASFTGNDEQKLMDAKQEKRIRKKVEKVMGALQLSMDSVFDIDVSSKLSMVDPDDQTILELDPEILPSTMDLSSSLGKHDDESPLSDLEFDHEPFAYCNFDLKLKDDHKNDTSSRSTLLLP